MNPNSNAILFAGQEATVTLRDGSTALVRVRELPARHHLEILDLFHVGREADLIQRCTERCVAEEAGARKWQPLFAPVHPDPMRRSKEAEEIDAAGRAFVDNLSDDSHEHLVAECSSLNFSRAIKTAQRQIARGQELRPLMETMSRTMLAPLRQELASWTSSLTSQLSAALAAPKP